MFGLEILDVAIGIIFVYILVSTICSAVREGIEGWFKTRAAYLEHGIRVLLHDVRGSGIASSFFTHPLIAGLFPGEYNVGQEKPGVLAKGGDLPSYIPSRNFALALMDLAARGLSTTSASSDATSPIISLDAIRANVGNLRNPHVQRAVLAAIDSAQGDLNRAQANLEAWFDSAMDRVSGWYKRSTQWVIFWIAIFVTVSMNIDTIAIARHLYEHEEARANIVALAEKANASGKVEGKAREVLEKMRLPIGWEDWKWVGVDDGDWPELATTFAVSLAGWLLTAMAATLGAPFWFDVLNKVMVIRATVKPREKSQEEGSEDRRQTNPPATQTTPPPATQTTPPPASKSADAGTPASAPPPLPEQPPEPAVRPGEDLDGCMAGEKNDDETKKNGGK